MGFSTHRAASALRSAVEQGLRAGELPWREWRDLYLALEPEFHLAANDPRTFDADAMTHALRQLPTGIFAQDTAVFVDAGDLREGGIPCDEGLGTVMRVVCCLLACDVERRKTISGTPHPIAADLAAVGEGPRLYVDSALHPDVQSRRGQSRARRLLGDLAERGMGREPVYLTFGISHLRDMLSPYTRDLQPHLARWAGCALEDEDAVYAGLPDFLSQDPTLGPERDAADAGVGLRLVALPGGVDVLLVDFRRLDRAACDSRIGGCLPTTGVVLALPASGRFGAGALAATLVDTLGARLQHVLVGLDGAALGDGPGVVTPAAALDWCTGATLPGPPVRAGSSPGDVVLGPCVESLPSSCFAHEGLAAVSCAGGSWFLPLWSAAAPGGPLSGIPTDVCVFARGAMSDVGELSRDVAGWQAMSVADAWSRR